VGGRAARLLLNGAPVGSVGLYSRFCRFALPPSGYWQSLRGKSLAFRTRQHLAPNAKKGESERAERYQGANAIGNASAQVAFSFWSNWKWEEGRLRSKTIKAKPSNFSNVESHMLRCPVELKSKHLLFATPSPLLIHSFLTEGSSRLRTCCVSSRNSPKKTRKNFNEDSDLTKCAAAKVSKTFLVFGFQQLIREVSADECATAADIFQCGRENEPDVTNAMHGEYLLDPTIVNISHSLFRRIGDNQKCFFSALLPFRASELLSARADCPRNRASPM
jgi:hypothetical protein